MACVTEQCDIIVTILVASNIVYNILMAVVGYLGICLGYGWQFASGNFRE